MYVKGAIRREGWGLADVAAVWAPTIDPHNLRRRCVSLFILLFFGDPLATIVVLFAVLILLRKRDKLVIFFNYNKACFEFCRVIIITGLYVKASVFVFTMEN